MNSPIEFGLRALVLLSQIEDEGIDIDRLLIYDYLLTNSGEFNEELPSLHVETPYKYSKLIVKREVLKEGVKIFSSHGLIDITLTERGIYYKKSSYTNAFLANMTSKYKQELVNISKWIIEEVHYKDDYKIEEKINSRILEYGIEFYRE
jgi:hypothetical protein